MNLELFVLKTGWTLVHFAWQGTLLAFLYYLARMALTSAASRHVAGCLILGGMLISTIVTFQRIQRPEGGVHHLAAIVVAPPEVRLGQGTSRTAPASGNTAESDVGSARTRVERIFPWLVGGWSLGVMLLLARLGAGWWRLERIRREHPPTVPTAWDDLCEKLKTRMKVSSPVRIAHSLLVQTPSVIGWLKPIILMPASILTALTPEEMESILLHELAHIRRHDYAVNILQTVLETALFYHPAVWWLSREIRLEREHACDDLVVRITERPTALACALARLELWRSSPALALSAGGTGLTQRIKRLMGPAPAGNASPVAIACLLGLLAFLAAATVSVRAQQQASSQSPDEVKTRVFAVTTTNLLDALFPGVKREDRKLAEETQTRLKDYLKRLRVTDLTGGKPLAKSVFLDVNKSSLFARATTQELDKLEKVLEILDHPPSVLVTARLFEMAQPPVIPPDAFQPGTADGPDAVLTEQQLRDYLEGAKTEPGTRLVASPRAMLQAGHGGMASVSVNSEVETDPLRGWQVEILPEIAPSGHEIQLSSTLSYQIRLNGKNTPEQETTFSVNAVGYVTIKRNGFVYDGQTLMVRATNLFGDKSLLTLLTVQLVDGKGKPLNRVKSFDPNTVPGVGK